MRKFLAAAFAIIAVAVMYSLTMPDSAPNRVVSTNGECTVKVRRDKYGISCARTPPNRFAPRRTPRTA